MFFHPSLLLLFLDPGSEIRDPGWVKMRILDKHSGSATHFDGTFFQPEHGGHLHGDGRGRGVRYDDCQPAGGHSLTPPPPGPPLKPHLRSVLRDSADH
jgi:hypothetical protein